jgi:hypothetical protein
MSASVAFDHQRMKSEITVNGRTQSTAGIDLQLFSFVVRLLLSEMTYASEFTGVDMACQGNHSFMGLLSL